MLASVAAGCWGVCVVERLCILPSSCCQPPPLLPQVLRAAATVSHRPTHIHPPNRLLDLQLTTEALFLEACGRLVGAAPGVLTVQQVRAANGRRQVAGTFGFPPLEDDGDLVHLPHSEWGSEGCFEIVDVNPNACPRVLLQCADLENMAVDWLLGQLNLS